MLFRSVNESREWLVSDSPLCNLCFRLFCASVLALPLMRAMIRMNAINAAPGKAEARPSGSALRRVDKPFLTVGLLFVSDCAIQAYVSP